MWDYADIYKKDQFAFSYATIHEWMYKKAKNKTITDFLNFCGYKSFALCALSSLGILFLEQIRQEGLEPAYIIEKNYTISKNIKVISPGELPTPIDVDVIIICHVYYYNKIADELAMQGIPEAKMISLNDIIFSM